MVANLPYIPSSRIPKLDTSVKDFEPHLALDGGSDGLGIIRRLLNKTNQDSDISKLLKPNGKIILEIDADHRLEDFAEFRRDWKMEMKKDKFSRNRFLLITQTS